MLKPALCTVALLLLLTTAEAQRVRLVDGPSPREGRLEVRTYRYGWSSWGTVCDSGFSHSAARVFCYMLGTDESDGFSVTATEPAADEFGWTTYGAMDMKRT